MIDPMPGDIFETGEVLNNTYEILRVLGRGGTGEVYLARNQVVDREVAIKALNSQFSGNSDYVELMKREEEMRDIVHSAVVRYSECSRSDQGHVFLVMEFVDGPSVNDLMLERRLEDKELLIIAHRVLQGLILVHKHRIVHRDLSPDNILLRGGSPEQATIIDFGIAKDTSAGARTIVGNQFAGKYEYAAPEQLEGQADSRTDFYALGASLLAAHRREIPFPGATPGEIIRRKQHPLDTEGVKQPLKDLIDWLTAPDPNNRPQDAHEALARVDTYLKAPGADRREAAVKPRFGRVILSTLLAAAVIGGALWFGGAFNKYLTPPLPNASPYELNASLNMDGTVRFSSHAPTESVAQSLRSSFAQAAGAIPQVDGVTLANGMPSLEWPDQMNGLMDLVSGLEHWELAVTNTDATLTGLAADGATRALLLDEISNWASSSGVTISPSLTAGPAILTGQAVQAELAKVATCGALRQSAGDAAGYGLFETIKISGDIANSADQIAIKNALAAVIGDRQIRLDTVTLNDDLCAIRKVLPVATSANLSIWLGDGATGESKLSGVFTTRQNPVVEIHFPADITEGSLWVMLVDNTGKVFHLLPHINHPIHNVSNIGTVVNGVRQVRVLHSVEEFKVDNSLPAMQVNQGDYGKSEVIAILTHNDLFDLRRPRDESVTSVAEALAETLVGREDDIIGVASRIIDARP